MDRRILDHLEATVAQGFQERTKQLRAVCEGHFKGPVRIITDRLGRKVDLTHCLSLFGFDVVQTVNMRFG